MYILHLSFCGADFHGWQIQLNARSIQQTLRNALVRMFDTEEFTNPSGCGRTDQGVHAIEFIATVKAVRELPTDNMRMGLNSFLPRSIRVMKVERVDGYRDARALVVGKQYRYLIARTDALSPFLEHLVWQSVYPLDIAPMRACLPHLTGTRDFKSFQASNTEIEETVRTIHRIEIQEQGPFVVIDVVGDGFLKHMVRILCGTLVAAGKGRIAPAELPAILAARDRSGAGETLPGKGLYLYRLFRDEETLRNATIPPFSTDMLWNCR